MPAPLLKPPVWPLRRRLLRSRLLLPSQPLSLRPKRPRQPLRPRLLPPQLPLPLRLRSSLRSRPRLLLRWRLRRRRVRQLRRLSRVRHGPISRRMSVVTTARRPPPIDRPRPDASRAPRSINGPRAPMIVRRAMIAARRSAMIVRKAIAGLVRTPPPAETLCAILRWPHDRRLAPARAAPAGPVVPPVQEPVRPRLLQRRKSSAPHVRPPVPAARPWTVDPRKTIAAAGMRVQARP